MAGFGPHVISGTGFCLAPEKSISGATKGFGSVDIGFNFTGTAGLVPSLFVVGAVVGAAGASALAEPSMLATWSITSAPPTGQDNPSVVPFSVAAFTSAAAKPGQPGKPQPPQLACGNMADICPMRGSSSTANFLAHKYNIIDATSAMMPSVSTDDRIKFIIVDSCISFCYFFMFSFLSRK
jgi:hypothetical protein